jgi:purine-binding chemotaxis protein CheW
VPVVDLRTKFGLSKTESTVNTRIIVMELIIDDEVTVVGALADSVHDVAEIDAAHIDPPPKIGSRWQTEFVKAIGKRDDHFLMILDIDRVFSVNELAALDAAAEGEAAVDEHTVIGEPAAHQHLTDQVAVAHQGHAQSAYVPR